MMSEYILLFEVLLFMGNELMVDKEFHVVKLCGFSRHEKHNFRV